jgi:hypothetical protein
MRSKARLGGPPRGPCAGRLRRAPAQRRRAPVGDVAQSGALVGDADGRRQAGPGAELPGRLEARDVAETRRSRAWRCSGLRSGSGRTPRLRGPPWRARVDLARGAIDLAGGVGDQTARAVAGCVDSPEFERFEEAQATGAEDVAQARLDALVCEDRSGVRFLRRAASQASRSPTVPRPQSACAQARRLNADRRRVDRASVDLEPRTRHRSGHGRTVALARVSRSPSPARQTPIYDKGPAD